MSEQRGARFDLVLVDNGSTDDSRDLTARLFPKARIINLGKNMGFAAAVNAGISMTSTPFVALLNNDTVPEPDWLACLLQALQAAGPQCGSAASLMLDMANPCLVENAGDILTRQGLPLKRGRGKPASLFAEPAEILSACAGAALYRRNMLERAGGFDEAFFAYFEDVDLGLRARLFGFGCVYAPNARVRHKGHGSSLARARYARLASRNRIMLLYKNLPAALLKRHAPELLMGTLRMFVGHKRPFHTLAGILDAWRARQILCSRREHIKANTKLGDREIENLFHSKTP